MRLSSFLDAMFHMMYGRNPEPEKQVMDQKTFDMMSTAMGQTVINTVLRIWIRDPVPF